MPKIEENNVSEITDLLLYRPKLEFFGEKASEVDYVKCLP